MDVSLRRRWFYTRGDLIVVTKAVSWPQFYLFLIEQLQEFMTQESHPGSLPSTSPGASEAVTHDYTRHTRTPSGFVTGSRSEPQPQFNIDIESPGKFNWSGLSEAYASHVKRQLADIPVVLGLASYVEGVTMFNPRLNREMMYRKFPLAMGISSGWRQVQFAKTAYLDLMAGQFPGTDQDIFV